jgi:outer membrane protein assembly factor BamB
VFALDTDTGKIIWKNSDFEVGFHSVPAVSKDGKRIYYGEGAEEDEGDSFYCIDASNGSVIWEYIMAYPPRGYRGYIGGAIIAPDGTLYIASQHGWLISLTDNGESYTENWAYDNGAEMRMPPAMDAEGYLYVGSSDGSGYVSKVDSRTGKSAGGNWPVLVWTPGGDAEKEVFANIAVASDGTVYVNSEDYQLWALTPEGEKKWTIRFEQWGSDPLIRDDGRIIVASELQGAARVACIRDDGGAGVVEWTSGPIAKTLWTNETNVNVAPDGTIFITSGEHRPPEDLGPALLFAIQGNGQGLSTTAQWPKYMGNTQNDGIVRRPRENGDNRNAGGTYERFDVRQLRRLAGKGRWLEYAGNPVLIPGEKDAKALAEEWDGRAIGSMSVLKVGSTFHMYYEAWGKGTIQIGHAVSEDGVHWTKDPENPVLPRSEDGWDSGGRWDPFVLYEDGVFKMWYGATPRGNARGNFHWGYAVSKDGTHFEKISIISDEVAFAAFEDAHVVHDEETNCYYMYCWDREKEPKGLYRVQSANETDFDFTKAEPVKIEGLSDTPMHKFTHVFKENGTWYMYYAEFKRPRCHDCATGYATSDDGLNWKVQNGNLLYAQDAEIVKADEDLYLMYYGPNGFFDGKGCDIRLALYAGSLDDLAATRQTEISLFNGKDLTGWQGDPKIFRVEDGAIVVGKLGYELEHNDYLCTTTTYENFELRLQVKVSSDYHANSGIQFRTVYQEDHYEVRGFQADTGFHRGKILWGGLWDNGRRNTDLVAADPALLKKLYRPNDWNDMVVRCQRNHIQIWFNGMRTVDYMETAKGIERSGMIGFQAHVGPPSETRFRNIYIKEL